MKIRHLNCGTCCPSPRRLICGPERKMICHCLLIEAGDRLILVDTGLGRADLDKTHSRIGRSTLSVLGSTYDPSEAAYNQLTELGYDPAAVTDILLTHLDLDHAGGLSDFPQARVHLLDTEYKDATRPQTFLSKWRYRKVLWEHHPHWETYAVDGGEPWFGFETVRDLRGLPPEILFVPLPGHTLGHAGIAIKQDTGWLIHCGDAFYYHADLSLENPKAPPGLRFFARMMAADNEMRLENLDRIRHLAHDHAGKIEVCTSHDPLMFYSLRSVDSMRHRPPLQV